MCEFEFDQNKSLSNADKHGINFIQAQQLWQDPNLVEINAKTTDEPRSLAIARINGKTWSAIFTYRAKVIRLISVRRARKTEVALYES